MPNSRRGKSNEKKRKYSYFEEKEKGIGKRRVVSVLF